MGMEYVRIAQEKWLVNRIKTEDKRRNRTIKEILISVAIILVLFTGVAVSNMDIVKASASAGRMVDAQYWDAKVINCSGTMFETLDGHIWEVETPVLDEQGNALTYGSKVRIFFDGMHTTTRTDDEIIEITQFSR